MTTYLGVIDYAEATGHEISLEGDKLRIARGAHLPEQLREEIKGAKADLLSALMRDKEAKKHGFIVGIPGAMYFRTVSRFSTVYIELIDAEWHAWRETYQDDRSVAVSTKTIVQATTFDHALKKVNSYFGYINRFRR